MVLEGLISDLNAGQTEQAEGRFCKKQPLA